MDEDRKLYGGPFALFGEGRGRQLGAGPAREAWLREERGGASARGASPVRKWAGLHSEGAWLQFIGRRGLFWKGAWLRFEEGVACSERGRGSNFTVRVLFERGRGSKSKEAGPILKGGVAPILKMRGLFKKGAWPILGWRRDCNLEGAWPVRVRRGWSSEGAWPASQRGVAPIPRRAWPVPKYGNSKRGVWKGAWPVLNRAWLQFRRTGPIRKGRGSKSKGA